MTEPEFFRFGGVDEIAPGQMIARMLDGKAVLAGRTAAGEWFACEDRCPHAGAKLSRGTLQEETLQCPLHGWMFDTRKGCSVPEPSAFCLRMLKTRITLARELWVSWG